MKKTIKPNNYWRFLKCQEEALKYNKRSDFRIHSSGAYSAARLNGWLNQICLHMIISNNPYGYWTKMKCQEYALMCHTRTEFYVKHRAAYSAVHRKKWLDEICKHMTISGNKYNRCIYAYEFTDNQVYIGLTYNITKRNSQRKSSVNDQVTKYVAKTNLTPIIKQLTKYLPVNKAIQMEKYYVMKYMENGWVVLNKAKTGSIGGNNYIWSFEKVKETALKYNKRIIFRRNNKGAYDSAWRNGWLNDVCSHMTAGIKSKNYWTKELCQLEALKYNSRTEFLLKSRSAYDASNKNNWLDYFYPKRYQNQSMSSKTCFFL